MLIIRDHLTAKHGPASREPIAARYLVLHDTEGAMPGVLSWLADVPSSRAPVSVHYLVCRDGTVYQICRDQWSAWHAGRTYWADRSPGVSASATGNYDMHGIEIEHVTANEGKRYPAKQLRALDELVALLYSRHHYLGTVGHKDIAYPRGRKDDPQLNVYDYSIAAVNARLGQTQEGDMLVTDEERQRWNKGRISEITHSYKLSIMDARIADIMEALGLEDTPAVLELKAQMARDVANEKAKLGL